MSLYADGFTVLREKEDRGAGIRGFTVRIRLHIQAAVRVFQIEKRVFLPVPGDLSALRIPVITRWIRRQAGWYCSCRSCIRSIRRSGSRSGRCHRLRRSCHRREGRWKGLVGNRRMPSRRCRSHRGPGCRIYLRRQGRHRGCFLRHGNRRFRSNSRS